MEKIAKELSNDAEDVLVVQIDLTTLSQIEKPGGENDQEIRSSGCSFEYRRMGELWVDRKSQPGGSSPDPASAARIDARAPLRRTRIYQSLFSVFRRRIYETLGGFHAEKRITKRAVSALLEFKKSQPWRKL
ncbi:MAG: hypothetical protein ACRDFQ_02355 [Anaerolineales bacterium]